MPYELINDNQEESALGTLGRGIARTGARVAESVAGLPGDLLGGVAGLGNLITGGNIPGLQSIQENPFTSQSIRKNVTQKLTGNALEPQGGTEQFFDEVVGDIATLLTPGGIASKGASLTGKGLAKAGAKALAGATVAGGVRSLGGSDQAAGLAKLATSVIGNTIGGRAALKKQMNQNYADAEFAIPNGAKIGAVPLRTKLGHDIKVITKGVSPVKNEMLGVLEGVRNNISKDGKIGVKDAWNLKRNINEWIGNDKIDKVTKRQLSKTLGDLNSSLGDYAKKNSDFANSFYPAEDMYKAIHQGSTVNKFLQNNVTLRKSLDKWQPASALGYSLYHFNLAKPTTIVGGFAGGFGAREVVKMTEFLYNSPQARKYYASLIKASLAGDAATAAKDIRKIDQLAASYEKNQPQGRYELVE